MIARGLGLVLWVLAGSPLAGAQAAGEDEAKLSIDVREGDLRRMLAALAEVGDVQIVPDPDVTCRLTLSVSRLSWSEVLSQVLRACRLGAEGAGRVLRVAPLERIARETRERRALSEARGDPARGVSTRTLSYARAEEVAPAVRALIGPGAEVVFDRRTNALIIVRR